MGRVVLLGRKYFWLSLLTSLSITAGCVPFPWIAYYGDQATEEELLIYNPIILQGNTHLDLTTLVAQKKEVLGYVNVGEIDSAHPFFQIFNRRGFLVHQNLNWPESWVADIRNPFWKHFIIYHEIPPLLRQGFTGIFLDQIDVALALEQEDPNRYAGMQHAAKELILSIRKQFPQISIMLNRGYELLPSVGSAIDYELAETLYTLYDFKQKRYSLRTEEEYQWQLQQLNQARSLFPHLVLFSLEYWDPKDKQGYEKIYSIEEKACLRPYVTTINLDEIGP